MKFVNGIVDIEEFKALTKALELGYYEELGKMLLRVLDLGEVER